MNEEFAVEKILAAYFNTYKIARNHEDAMAAAGDFAQKAGLGTAEYLAPTVRMYQYHMVAAMRASVYRLYQKESYTLARCHHNLSPLGRYTEHPRIYNIVLERVLAEPVHLWHGRMTPQQSEELIILGAAHISWLENRRLLHLRNQINTFEWPKEAA